MDVTGEIRKEADIFCPYRPTMGMAGLKRMNRWKDKYCNMSEIDRFKVKRSTYENKLFDNNNRLSYLQREIPILQAKIENIKNDLNCLIANQPMAE